MRPSGSPGRPRYTYAIALRRAGLASGFLAVGVGAIFFFGLAGGGGADASQYRRLTVRPEVPVTATDLLVQSANNSPQLVVDPNDERAVVLANRLDGPDFGCALQLSGDGGRSWVPAEPVPTLPKGAEKCYAPEVAFDRSGKLYYLFIGLAGPGNRPVGTFLTTSADRGGTFTPPRKILGPGRYMVRMALDSTWGNKGRIHLVWLETSREPSLGGLPSPPNPIMAAYSDDGGKTFSNPVQVSDTRRQRVVAPAVALGPDHQVHVVYYDLHDDVVDYQGLEGPTWEGSWSLVLASSNDAGRRFGPSVVVDDQVVPPERVMLIFTMAPPSLVADKAGQVYVAWHDGRNGDWDAFVRRSRDGGRSWDRVVRLNDDPLENGRHQYLPRLAVAPTGRIDAIFYDRRGNVENRGVDVYYTFATEGATRFASNRKLTAVDFDSRVGPRYGVAAAVGMFEFGSRIALASRHDRVLAAWTDTRNTFRAPPAQDIYATEVAFSSDSGIAGWTRLTGAGLVLAGAVVFTCCVRAGRRRHTVAVRPGGGG